VITGWGTSLPPKILTNHDLEQMMDTSHDWIVERSGIHQRHVGGTTVGLSTEAGRAALDMSGVDLSEIDGLVLATTTPDSQWGTAAAVQNHLGLRCGAFDVNAACSGFVYGLITAHGMIAMGARKVLLIGTDSLSRIVDWKDRNTAVLFGDGSGAVVLEAVEGPGQLLAWDLDADGSLGRLLWADVGGFIHMEGKEVFRRAVRIMVDSGTKSLDHAGLTADDISLVIPHQANIRIINAACERLGIDPSKAVTVLDRTGNTSSASVPLALADALDNGRIKEGDLLLLVGFGGGMTAASAVLRWGGGAPAGEPA
jgi:3-oxoacyl-[acyl-carrier-protein] synthase-3